MKSTAQRNFVALHAHIVRKNHPGITVRMDLPPNDRLQANNRVQPTRTTFIDTQPPLTPPSPNTILTTELPYPDVSLSPETPPEPTQTTPTATPNTTEPTPGTPTPSPMTISKPRRKSLLPTPRALSIQPTHWQSKSNSHRRPAILPFPNPLSQDQSNRQQTLSHHISVQKKDMGGGDKYPQQQLCIPAQRKLIHIILTRNEMPPT